MLEQGGRHKRIKKDTFKLVRILLGSLGYSDLWVGIFESFFTRFEKLGSYRWEYF